MTILRFLASVAFLAVFGCVAVRAQTANPTAFYANSGSPPASGTGGFNAVTAGITSAKALPAAPHTCTLIEIDNESSAASIAACFGSSCTAALNTAGSFTIAPGTTRIWSGPYVPADQINIIASAASTPVTIEAHCD